MTEFGNFDGAAKTSEFADATCNSDHLTRAAGLGGQTGRLAVTFASYSGGGEWCYGDTSQVRVHLIDFASGGPSFEPGFEVVWVSSIRRRTGSHASSVVLHEIHAEHVGCALGSGPAPFNLMCRNDAGTPRWSFVVRGWDDCAGGGFVQHMYGAGATFTAIGDGSSQGDRVPHAWAGGVSDAAADDEWLHFCARWVLSGDPAVGRFQAWACKGLAAPVMVEIVPEAEIATCYPIGNYPILSLYYANVAGTADYEFGAGAIFDNLADAQAWQTARLETTLGGDPWTGFGGGGGGGGGSYLAVPVALASDDDDRQHDRWSTVYATVAAGGGSYALDNSGPTLLEPARGLYGSDYYISCVVLRFNTGAAIAAELGPGESFDTCTRCALLYNVPTTGTDANGRNVVAEWIADWGTADSGDWAEANAADALNEDLTTINVSGDGERDLLNPENVNPTGWTALRIGISGGAPAGGNHWRMAAREHATGRPPALELDFTVTTAGGGSRKARCLLLAA